MFKSIGSRSPGEILLYGESADTAARDTSMVHAWYRLAARVRAGIMAVAEWHNMRRAERELHALDDRTLKDIGMHRSEIGRVLRHGRL